MGDNNLPGIPVCKECGAKLGVLTSIGVICSSDYIGGPLCYDCQIEHCLSTNCYACNMGVYPDCQHLERKKLYMQMED